MNRASQIKKKKIKINKFKKKNEKLKKTICTVRYSTITYGAVLTPNPMVLAARNVRGLLIIVTIALFFIMASASKLKKNKKERKERK